MTFEKFERITDIVITIFIYIAIILLASRCAYDIGKQEKTSQTNQTQYVQIVMPDGVLDDKVVEYHDVDNDRVSVTVKDRGETIIADKRNVYFITKEGDTK